MNPPYLSTFGLFDHEDDYIETENSRCLVDIVGLGIRDDSENVEQ